VRRARLDRWEGSSVSYKQWTCERKNEVTNDYERSIGWRWERDTNRINICNEPGDDERSRNGDCS
jgi:hypothetical protein